MESMESKPNTRDSLIDPAASTRAIEEQTLHDIGNQRRGKFVCRGEHPADTGTPTIPRHLGEEETVIRGAHKSS